MAENRPHQPTIQQQLIRRAAAAASILAVTTGSVTLANTGGVTQADAPHAQTATSLHRNQPISRSMSRRATPSVLETDIAQQIMQRHLATQAQQQRIAAEKRRQARIAARKAAAAKAARIAARKAAAEKAAREQAAREQAAREAAEQAAQLAAANIDPGTLRAQAYQWMLDYGFAADQWAALDRLVTRESGWNPTAQNGSSGAYGLPQSLPGSKMASIAPDWRTNPHTQMTWMFNYIKARYGNPAGAWAHSEATGWY